MSDPAAEPSPTEPTLADPPQAPRPAPILSDRWGAAAIGVATALIVFGLLVITGPFWAPSVIPLLAGGAVPKSPEPVLAERLARLEAASREDQQKTMQAVTALQKTVADAAATVQQLDRRVAAQENRPAPAPPDLGDIRQQLQALTTADADLKMRVAVLEKSEQSQTANDSTDTALLLAVLPVREALDTARPFVAEYDALAALAKSRPEIAAAVAPLAEPAKNGVASRAVLIDRLRGLAGTIAIAETAPASGNWGARAWAQLRGLVTIRRVDGAGQSAPEAAVSAAERSLAAGDLAGAVAALEPLTGPAADAARPWVQMARQRLAVDKALHQVESLLVARLGSPR